MPTCTDANAVAIGETVDAKVKPIIINQPVNLMYLHRNEDDATKARHCPTQTHPLNSSNHSTPQPWETPVVKERFIRTHLQPQFELTLKAVEPITMACVNLKSNWTWLSKTTHLSKLVLLLYRIHTSLQLTNTSHTKSILGSKCHVFPPQFRTYHPRALLCTLKIIILPYPVLLPSLFQCQPLRIRSKDSHQVSMTCSDLPNTSSL